MKKSTTIALVALLLIALILPQTMADTSQGFFYNMEDGDRFYFTLELEEDGMTTYDEVFFIEIENASKPIPDPLTNLGDLDYLDVDFAYENGSSMGILPIIFIFAGYLEYPVGNWNLITSLAGTDLEGLLLGDARNITITQNDDIWGYSYKFNDSIDTETTVWIDYSKFDGLMSYYYVEYRNTTTSELLGFYKANRVPYHNLEWGCSDGDQFNFHLNMTGDDFGFHDVDEDFYLEINADGLPIILYTTTEWDDIPYIDGNLYWANDTIFFDSILSYSWRVAVPIGNWSLLDNLLENKPSPTNLTLDDSDSWFWGYSWSDITSGDIQIETHTDYLKVDGVIARHSVTFTNTTSSEVVGTINIERLNLEPYTDRSAPVINHPVDIEFVEGAENQSIVWGLIDDNPTTYEVTVNGTAVDSDSWTSGDNIVLDLDEFEAGEYTCTITAYDIAGNSATDSVLVTVTATVTDPGGSLTDLIMDNILYIAIGAGAIILIGAVVLMRRRS